MAKNKAKISQIDGKKERTWLKRDRYPYAAPLTDKDRLQLCEEMANTKAKIEGLAFELKNVSKTYRSDMEYHEKELAKAARIIRDGKWEPEHVECDVYQDWETEELVWISRDERIEVYRRKMTAEEKQPTLFEEAPDAKENA